MLVSEKRSVGNNGCLRHTLMPEAAATLGRVHTSSPFYSVKWNTVTARLARSGFYKSGFIRYLF